jgi:hypothetical protein
MSNRVTLAGATLAAALLATVSGCTAGSKSDTTPTPPASTSPGKPSASRLVDPASLAQLLGNPQISRNNRSVGGAEDYREPLTSCALPLRGALRWAAALPSLNMYDISTYDSTPGHMDGVITVSGSNTPAQPGPLALARADLAKCGVRAQDMTVAGPDGRLPALRFTFGPPLHSDGTLLILRPDKGVIALLLSHPSQTRAADLRDGLTRQERATLALALARAGSN